MFSDIWHRSNFYLWFQYWHVYFQKMNEFRFTFANIWFWTNSKSDYYILSYDLFGSSIVKWKSDKAKRIRTDYELYGLIWVIFSETRLFLKIGHHQTILSGIFYMPITGKRGELIFWHCRQTDFIHSKNPHTCRILAIFIHWNLILHTYTRQTSISSNWYNIKIWWKTICKITSPKSENLIWIFEPAVFVVCIVGCSIISRVFHECPIGYWLFLWVIFLVKSSWQHYLTYLAQCIVI